MKRRNVACTASPSTSRAPRSERMLSCGAALNMERASSTFTWLESSRGTTS
jgi:hypothetical protein